MTPTLAIHGGAGALERRDYGRELALLRGLVEAGRDRLRAGAEALDVTVDTVAALEASGLFVAGRGAAPNTSGGYELDAAVMQGDGRRAGAVAALSGFESPIRVARAVMEQTPHVLLVGQGAVAFARAQGFAAIADPAAWFAPPATSASPGHGTVGCVALDAAGGLAAATSTGGTHGKLPGRVGDSPIIGAGTWADEALAVSCTGLGEAFLRSAAAAQLAWRTGRGGEDLDLAAQGVLDEVKRLGGEGGLIAVDARGRIALRFNAAGMLRAALGPDGAILAEAF